MDSTGGCHVYSGKLDHGLFRVVKSWFKKANRGFTTPLRHILTVEVEIAVQLLYR